MTESATPDRDRAWEREGEKTLVWVFSDKQGKTSSRKWFSVIYSESDIDVLVLQNQSHTLGLGFDYVPFFFFLLFHSLWIPVQ